MNLEQKAFEPTTHIAVHSPAADTEAQISLGSPGDRRFYVVTAYGFSASGAPAAAVNATLAVQPAGGGTPAIPHRIPAAAFAPYAVSLGRGAIRCVPAAGVTLTLPALGAGIEGSVWLAYFIGHE